MHAQCNGKSNRKSAPSSHDVRRWEDNIKRMTLTVCWDVTPCSLVEVVKLISVRTSNLNIKMLSNKLVCVCTYGMD